MPPEQAAKYEHMTMRVSTALAGLAFIGMLFFGWWANANDDKIEKNTDAITKLTTGISDNEKQISRLLIIVENNQDIVRSAGENAQKNRESLIRIETKLEKDEE